MDNPTKTHVPASYIIIWNNLVKTETPAIASRETRELTYIIKPSTPYEIKPKPIITDQYAIIDGKQFNLDVNPDERIYVSTRRH